MTEQDRSLVEVSSRDYRSALRKPRELSSSRRLLKESYISRIFEAD